jgi:hypothetical protein
VGAALSALKPAQEIRRVVARALCRMPARAALQVPDQLAAGADLLSSPRRAAAAMAQKRAINRMIFIGLLPRILGVPRKPAYRWCKIRSNDEQKVT